MAFDTSGIRLKPCVDLFSTEASRQDASLEKIREIPLDQLVPFKDHPFKVIDDESMMDTVQSIREHGILLPLIARPMPDGKYEIVSGHRRSHAGKLAGLETVPVIVRELDDDTAVILMVDSNLQRENILPSERAFAFKMKLEAMKHQGQTRRFNFWPSWPEVEMVCGHGSQSIGKTHKTGTAVYSIDRAFARIARSGRRTKTGVQLCRRSFLSEPGRTRLAGRNHRQ